MKKPIYSFLPLCAFASIFILSGCSKAYVPGPPIQQQLEGRWTLQSAIGHYVVYGNPRNDTTTFTSADYLQFNTDGTLNIHEGSNTPTGKWKVENDKLIISETNYMDYPNGFDISIFYGSQLQLSYHQQDQTSTLDQQLNLAR